jgi:tyrosine-protein kinase Etk/Wzc
METPQKLPEQKEINILDIFIICLKRKRLIVLGSAVLALITAGAGLIMTPMFRATTGFMPPQASGGSSTMGQLLGQFAGVASLVLGTTASTTGNLYVGLLQTEGVLNTIIDKFDVMKVANLKTREDARDFLIKSVLIADMNLDSGIVTISADDPDPKRSMEMTNTFATELKKVFDSIATTDAGKRRVFFENQLNKTNKELANAELSLRNFAETTGAIRVDEQATATLQVIMGMKSTIAGKEVELEVLKTFAAKNNPDMKRAERELQSLRQQLKQLEERQEIVTPGAVIPTEQIPSLGMEYLRRYREFKYQEMLYELLVKQYEAARLEEAKESTPVQIIYEANLPTRPAKPRLFLLTFFAGGLGFFLCSLLAFFIELYKATSEKESFRERYRQLHCFMRRV